MGKSQLPARDTHVRDEQERRCRWSRDRGREMEGGGKTEGRRQRGELKGGMEPEKGLVSWGCSETCRMIRKGTVCLSL